MWPECQGTLSHAPFVDFLVIAMERRRTAVRAEILYTSLYIVLSLLQGSPELYIYTSYTLYIPIHSPSAPGVQTRHRTRVKVI